MLKNIGDIVYPWNMKNLGVLQPNAIPNPNFAYIHVLETLGQRGPATPVDGTPVIFIQSCRVRHIREIEICHDVADHLDGFGPLIHCKYLGLTRAPRGFGFVHSAPSNRSAAPN
jgi:hypothetical protein